MELNYSGWQPRKADFCASLMKTMQRLPPKITLVCWKTKWNERTVLLLFSRQWEQDSNAGGTAISCEACLHCSSREPAFLAESKVTWPASVQQTCLPHDGQRLSESAVVVGAGIN